MFAEEPAYNHGLKAWDKFALLGLLRTRQTRILLHLPNLVVKLELKYIENSLLNYGITIGR